MPSIFSKIITREIPAFVIAEDHYHLAFLDINPLKKGHTLVIPKVEVDYIYDLTDDQLSSLHVFAKKVAHAMGKAIVCDRIGVTVIGLEVPHAHIHLIPIDHVHDMNFENDKLSFTEEEFQQIAKQIQAKL